MLGTTNPGSAITLQDHTKGSIEEARDGVLRTTNPDLAVPLRDLFENA